jgi:hypothetical protein
MLLLSSVAQPMETPALVVHDEAMQGLTPKPPAVLPLSKCITAEVCGMQARFMPCWICDVEAAHWAISAHYNWEGLTMTEQCIERLSERAKARRW